MAGVWQRCVGVHAGRGTGSVSVCLPCCRWQALLLDLLLVESIPSAGPGAWVWFCNHCDMLPSLLLVGSICAAPAE